MTKKAKSKAEIRDPEEVVISDAMFARAKRRDQLPSNIERLLPRRPGPGQRTAKRSVTPRLSPQVIEAFKSTGQGWQTRINEALDVECQQVVPFEA